METVSRAGWNARAPRYTNALTLSKVDKFIVHYSGASRSQTIRSIQDYCMDTKGHSDIDYNALVKDGKHYVGRGYSIGGHTLNNNSSSYGVCVVGNDGDATDADMNCVRDIYEMVCSKLGRRIRMTHHRGVLGASYTSCPGSELEAWVDAGMPYKATTIGGDDVFCKQDDPVGSGKVLVLQGNINTVMEFMGITPLLVLDDDYGPKTAKALLDIGCGNAANNGSQYWAGEELALKNKLREIAAVKAVTAHMANATHGGLPSELTLKIPAQTYTVPEQTVTVPIEP